MYLVAVFPFGFSKIIVFANPVFCLLEFLCLGFMLVSHFEMFLHGFKLFLGFLAANRSSLFYFVLFLFLQCDINLSVQSIKLESISTPNQ